MLHDELKAWFAGISVKRIRWDRDPVARLIKGELSKLGHWKNAKRGNAVKGGYARQRANKPDWVE